MTFCARGPRWLLGKPQARSRIDIASGASGMGLMKGQWESESLLPL